MRILFGFKFDYHAFLSFVVILCVAYALVEIVNAQPNIDNGRILRDAKRTATAIFVDRNRTAADRLAAAKKLGFPEEATLPSLLAIGIDRSEDDSIRLEAFLHHRFDEKYLNAVLATLADQDDGGVDLKVGLIDDLSRRQTFHLPNELKQRISVTYRMLMNDPREEVRVHAFRTLIANQDPAAIQRLTESFRSGGDFPIPLPEIIDLLDQDGAAKYIAVIRPYLGHTDPAVQARAARALAVDPQSRPMIISLAKNSQTPNEVRLHAIRALASKDDQFASYAIELMEDTSTDLKIRYAAMHGVAGRMNYHKVDAPTMIRFAQVVEKISKERNMRTTEEGRKVQQASKELHSHLRKSFPEIKRFYERR
jgi:HEAT repeat protein